MCGITGFLRYQTPVEDKIVYQVMSILFPRLMCAIEARGEDATGVYQVHENGDWMLTKTSRKASIWINTPRRRGKDDPIIFEDIIGSWGEHAYPVKALVGHARKATVGSKGRDNKDNHPFAVQLDEVHSILGVHNGTLLNHETVFQKLKELGSPLERVGTVDSECLFHLLYHASDGGSRPWTTEDLYSVARKVEGAYALVAMNSKFPNQVAVMRDGRSLEASMIAPLGLVVLASEKRFVDDAIAQYNMIRRFSYGELPELTVETRMIIERTCRIFDLSAPFPEGKLTWNDLDKLSEHRDLNKATAQLPEEDWRRPAHSSGTHTYLSGTGTSSTSSSVARHQKTNPTPAAGGGAVMGPTQKTKTPASSAPQPPVTAKVSKSNKQTGLTAEVTIPDSNGESIAKAALKPGRFIDLAPTFDSEGELAQALGISQIEVGNLDAHELASAVCELGFVQGYGMGRIECEKEVERVKKMGRNQSKELERMAGKWKRAQNLVWELKSLLVAACFIDDQCEGMLKEDNLQAVLAEMVDGDNERAARILKTYERMVEDKASVHLRKSLQAVMDEEDGKSKG